MKSVSKKVISLALTLLIVMSTLVVGSVVSAGATVSNPFVAGTKLYLKPNSDWLAASAKFAAYFFNSENGDSQKEWVEMSAVPNSSNVYEVTVPATYTYDRVNFARFAPSETIAWDHQWNQTVVQGKAAGNMCVITNDQVSDGHGGYDYTPYWDNLIEINNQDTYVYFDNSKTAWRMSNSGSWVYMMVVTSDKVYVSGSFNPVSNTVKLAGQAYGQLLYKNVATDFASVTWSDVEYLAFVQAPSSTSIKKTDGYDRASFIVSGDYSPSYVSYYTGKYTDVFKTSRYNRAVFVPQTESNNCVLTATNLGGSASGANSVMDLAQQVNVYTNDEQTNTGGSVSLLYNCTMSGLQATTENDHSESPVADTNGTLSFGAVQCTNVELSATPTAGYNFIGWYNGETLESSANPYTYVADGTKTLKAVFSDSGYPQTANAGEGGSVSVSDGTSSGASITVASGANVTFTALPAENFGFEGWYSNAEFTGSPVSTDDPYTVEDVDSANTLYAKFAPITVDSEGSVALGSNKNDKSRDPYHAVDEDTSYKTTLSAQAKSYYRDVVKDYITSSSGKVYETFADLADNRTNEKSITDPTFNDGDSYEAMQNNDLFDTLYDIMSTTHTHGVAYAAYGPNSLANYWLCTDTSDVNYDDGRGVYTFFYSDVDCFNHENMQREHIWPKSKASYLMKTGLGGSDLHHLRPAYGKVNNIKSNWGFADILDDDGSIKSGWTNVRTVSVPVAGGSPKTSLWRAEKDGETFCDYNEDVHGDIARILLYIYTRWKQPNLYTDIVDSNGDPDTSKLPELDPDDTKDTGERIIYDLPTLLQWMEEDPVSEWEMKRNDLTEDVQGNRNVFIDYPELAWLLFDQEVPADMDTPSGMAKDQDNSENTDITKSEDTRVYKDQIAMDFSTVTGNGKAEIKAYNNTTHKYVLDGDRVDRGDIITYSVIPDESTITGVREYNSSESAYSTFVTTSGSTQYSFTRQAGYYLGVPNTEANGGTDYKKERISVQLETQVCELSFKISSVTATYNPGGSGSGMVTARRTDTNAMLESGDTVPNETEVVLTFTPDYGSKFYGLTMNNTAQAATSIAGTDSYKLKVTLKPTSTTRVKTFNVKFAQTFNVNDKIDGVDRHIVNKGMRPEADDAWGTQTDFSTNFEICGVQLKEDEKNPENKALRFISVIDNKILKKAKSYGYVIGYTNQSLDTKTINRYAFTLVKDNPDVGVTLPCEGTVNQTFNQYGRFDADDSDRYTYITAAVNNLQENSDWLNTTIIARPYVELDGKYTISGEPEVIYGQYVDFTTGENYCACSGSYNYIAGLAA